MKIHVLRRKIKRKNVEYVILFMGFSLETLCLRETIRWDKIQHREKDESSCKSRKCIVKVFFYAKLRIPQTILKI